MTAPRTDPEAHAETWPIASSPDIVRIRQAVRERARELGFGLVDQTKMITAASELARNALDHGGGGEMRLEIVSGSQRRGLRLSFEDQGPGIPDVERALQDGYSTGQGLGLGLSGARRLVNDFRVESTPGRGTLVVITRWKM
jgi:serine/threonine-protein kinase RsbT